MNVAPATRATFLRHGAPLWLALAAFLATFKMGKGYECGGYVDLGSSPTGTITSPGYPGGYDNYTRCIWIFEAPGDHVTNLSVTFRGERYDSACSDYVEFRDGGPNDDIIQTNCDTMTSEIVTSTNQWMYVFFRSDGFSQVDGLTADWSATYVGSAGINSSIARPIANCRSFEFACANRLCLSMSYRCDGYRDCGCGADCDEHDCGGLPLGKVARNLVAVSVGVVVFLVAASLGRALNRTPVHGEKGKDAQAGDTSRRQGWQSGHRKSRFKPGYTPEPPPKDKTPSPRISSCRIKVSEMD